MTFYVTFTAKQSSENASAFNIDPEGYWAVESKTFSEALQISRSTFGRFGFANIQNDTQFNRLAYEKGQLGLIRK